MPMTGNVSGVTSQWKRSTRPDSTGTARSDPSSGPLLATPVATIASVINAAVAPRAPNATSTIAPATNAAICKSAPRCSRNQIPRASLSAVHTLERGNVIDRGVPAVVSATAMVTGVRGSRSSIARHKRSNSAESAGSPADSAAICPPAPDSAKTARPSFMPFVSAVPPGQTRTTVTLLPATLLMSGGRMPPSGRDSANCPKIGLPERTNPAPAGHKWGRRTNACSASTMLDSTSTTMTTSCSMETREADGEGALIAGVARILRPCATSATRDVLLGAVKCDSSV